MYVCIHVCMYLSMYVFVCLFVYLCMYLCVCLFIYFFVSLLFREQYGIPVLVKLLEAMPFDGVTAAAADALRALAMSNEANKTAIREAWAVPLLVKLLGSEVHTCFS